jgi:uncharacterized phiE125 gp8 family phage protein
MINGAAFRTVAPVALPVSVIELKDHTNLDGVEGKDALIATYIQAATDMVEQYTGLGLITQSWEQRFSAFDSTRGLTLARRPLRYDVGSPSEPAVSISYLDGDAALQPLDRGVYTVSGVGWDKEPAVLRLGYGQAWPVTYSHPETIRVTYTVGFGDTAASVPPLIRHAIMLAAATMFGFREDLVIGSTISELPWHSRALLAEWRPIALA